MSLSTGVVGGANINCHKAAEIGSQTMENFIEINFADMKQSKNNTVVPLSAMSNTVKVNNKTVIVDPLVIFQRTLINKRQIKTSFKLLKYDLSPYSMTLFDNRFIRKTMKPALYDKFPT